MKEKIYKTLSSKALLIILIVINLLLSLSYSVTGAVIFEQRLSFLLGNIIMIFIVFAISQKITQKGNIYNINLAVINYWLLYLFIVPLLRVIF